MEQIEHLERFSQKGELISFYQKFSDKQLLFSCNAHCRENFSTRKAAPVKIGADRFFIGAYGAVVPTLCLMCLPVMGDYRFEAIYEGKVRQVDISRPHGQMHEMFSVHIDRYYEGRIWLTEHYGWQWDHPRTSLLETEDFYYVIDLVKHLKL